jgi:hypothetical protein
MARRKYNQIKVTIGIIAIVLVLILASVLTQPLSISKTVNSRGTYSSVSSAISACEADRKQNQAQGMPCEPCSIACPSSAVKISDGSYTFTYPDSQLYSGTFTGVKCDPLVQPSGNLLQVKSYCNDNIRVCEKQDGTGTIKSTSTVENGKVQTVAYKSVLVDCDSGALYGNSGSVDYIGYQIVCNAGYTVDGRKASNSAHLLGTCVSINAGNNPANTPLAGSYSQFKAQATVAPGKEVVATATFDAKVSGKYYLYASIDRSSMQPLSISTAAGVQDLCGSDVNTAGTFKDLAAGDSVVVQFSMPAPKTSANYKLKVAARQGCHGSDMDAQNAAVRVIGDEQIKQEVISGTITLPNDKLTAEQDAIAAKYNDIVNLKSCDDKTDFKINGCAVAECVDNKVILYDDSGIRAKCTDQNGQAVADTVKGQQSLFAKYTDTSTTLGKSVVFGGAIIVVLLIALLVFARKQR